MFKQSRNRLTCIALLSLVFICGCDSSTESKALPAEVSELKLRTEALESKHDTLSIELSGVKAQVEAQSLAEMFRNSEKMVLLTPGGDGYQILPFDMGFITIRIADVKAYANGSKVNLMFGNPQFASINGISFKVDWGSTLENALPNNTTQRTKEFKILESLAAGTWTGTELILEGVPPAQLGFMRVTEFKNTGITLRSDVK